MFDTIEQMQLETGAGHDTSLPHDTQRAVKLIERLYEEWGRENLSVVVISDGYARGPPQYLARNASGRDTLFICGI